MIVSDNESTDTEGYAKEQDASTPLLSMLEKNVVADQTAWNEAFEGAQQDPSSYWILEEEEDDDDEDKNVSYSPKPTRATHTSCDPAVEGTTIDQSVHTLNPVPPCRTKYVF